MNATLRFEASGALLLALALTVALPAPEALAQDAARGEQLYKLCSQCHGDNGSGDASLAWLASGIAETVTNDLRATLRIIDRARVSEAVRAVGRELARQMPDGGPAVAMPAVPTPATTPLKPAGVVMVTTTVVDTGERKPAFGREARHVKTTMDKQPMPGACDQTKQRMETDGWYIDVPTSFPASSAESVTPPPVAEGLTGGFYAPFDWYIRENYPGSRAILALRDMAGDAGAEVGRRIPK